LPVLKFQPPYISHTTHSHKFSKQPQLVVIYNKEVMSLLRGRYEISEKYWKLQPSARLRKTHFLFKQDKPNNITVLTNKRPLFHILGKDGNKIVLMLN